MDRQPAGVTISGSAEPISQPGDPQTSQLDRDTDLTSRELNQRLVEAVLAQGRLQKEHERAVIGLNAQIAQLTRTIAELQASAAGTPGTSPDAAAAADPHSQAQQMANANFWRLRQAYWSLRAALWGVLSRVRRSPTPLGAAPAAPGLPETAARTRLEAVSIFETPVHVGKHETAAAGSAPSNIELGGSVSRNPLQGAAPLLLIGCARSGTTMAAKILNAHPAVLMTNETAVFLMLAHNIRNSRIGYAAGILYGKEHNQLWADHLTREARHLIEGYYARISAASHKTDLRYWGEKHPHHSNCFAFIDTLYPSARYIYMVRDPRDAACSLADMKAVGFPEGLAIWKMMSDAHEAFAATVAPERLWRLRYEDLVNDYEGVTCEMFAWLGLSAEPVADFLAQYQNVDAHTLKLAAPVKADFRSTSVGRWRRENPDERRQLAASLVGEFMERHGYEL